jgi:quercetin dioxygenase-like cupin family protein
MWLRATAPKRFSVKFGKAIRRSARRSSLGTAISRAVTEALMQGLGNYDRLKELISGGPRGASALRSLASKLSTSSATGVIHPRPPTIMLSGLARAASIFGNNVHIICMLLAAPVPVRLIMENTRSPPSYAVKNIETVANGSDLRARLYTLAPGDMIPWHFHSQITDWYFCLGGCLRIEMRASPAEELLAASKTYSIPPGTRRLRSAPAATRPRPREQRPG